MNNVSRQIQYAQKWKKYIVLTPKINQSADSRGGHLPLSGTLTQLREDIRDNENN